MTLDSSSPVILNDPTVTAASCSSDDDGQIEVNASGEGLTYQLDDGQIVSNPVFSNLPSGNYTITVYDAYGCIKTQNVAIPLGTLQLNSISLVHTDCSVNNTGEIHVTASSTNGLAITYTLNQGGNQVASNGNGNFTGLASGVYEVVITSDGCEITRNRRVQGLIDAGVINVVQADCNADNGSFEIQVNEGGNYEFSVNGGPWTTDPVFSNLAPGEYNIRIRNTSNDCIDRRLQVTIEENQTITGVNATSTPASCTANDGTITVTANSSGTITYTLYDADGNEITNNTSGLFTGLADGDYSVELNDGSSGCTFGPQNVTVSEDNDIGDITDFSTTNSDCNSPTGSISITVNATSGVVSYTLNSTQTNATGDFANIASGQHIVTVESNDGCTKDFEIFVPENNTINILSIVLTQPSTYCETDGAISILAEGVNPQFSLSEGGPFQAGTAVGENTEFTFENLNGGVYTIYIQDDEGCQKSTTATLNGGFSLNEITSTAATCGESNGVIHVDASGTNLQYRLDDGDYQDSPTFENVTPGSHTITVLIENDCEVSRTHIVDNVGNVSLDDVVVTPTICGEANASIEIIASPIDEITGYSIDGENFVSNNIFTDVAGGERYVYAEDMHGCRDSLLVQVPESTAPAPQFEISHSICDENNGAVVITVEGGVGEILYSFNNGAYSTINMFNSLSPGTYPVSVIDEVGCEVQDEIIIERHCEPLFPNSFTPNDDGHNDMMLLLYYLPLDIKTFTVHNTWGELVYEQADFISTDTNKWWDGGNRDAGSYLIHCVFTYEGEEKVFSGTVHLIR